MSHWFHLKYLCVLHTLKSKHMKTLAQAAIRTHAIVTGITDSALKPKLLEMGLYVGKDVQILFKAPFGDPIAVDVDGYVLSMRLDEARLIQIEDRVA